MDLDNHRSERLLSSEMTCPGGQSRVAVDELEEIATDSPYLRAVAAQAAGAVGVGDGDAQRRLCGAAYVARRLSNVFTKLGASSRAAATACASEHDLM